MSEQEQLNKLREENEQLREQVRQLKAKLSAGGKKPKFTDATKQSICKAYGDGSTIRSLAIAYECSVGLIHKIVKEG